MIEWIRKLIRVVAEFDQRVDNCESHINSLGNKVNLAEKTIRDRTNVSVDLCINGPSTVIVVGRYKGVDYIQTYSMGDSEFTHLVDHLKSMSRYGNLHRVDAPPQFKYVVDRMMI